MVQRLRQAFARLDALIDGAGIGGASTAAHETEPAEPSGDHVNLIGPFHMTRAAIPLILEGGRGGAVVNVGSILGRLLRRAAGASQPRGRAGPAGTAIALELGPQGIRVDTVAPGYMLTSMHEGTCAARHHERAPLEETVESLRSSVPLRRRRHPRGRRTGCGLALSAPPPTSPDRPSLSTAGSCSHDHGRGTPTPRHRSRSGSEVRSANGDHPGWRVIGVDRDALALDRVASATGSRDDCRRSQRRGSVELAIDHAAELLGTILDALVPAGRVYELEA